MANSPTCRKNSRATDEPRVQQSGESHSETIPRDAAAATRLLFHSSSSYTKHILFPWGQELWSSQHLKLKKKNSASLYTNLFLTMTFFCSILQTLRLLYHWIRWAQKKPGGCEFEWKCKHCFVLFCFFWPTMCKALKETVVLTFASSLGDPWISNTTLR